MGERVTGPHGPLRQTPPQQSLADRLLADGRITREKHEAVGQLLKRGGVRVEDALVDAEAITEQEMLKYLAAFYQVRFVSTERLVHADIDRATLDRVPKKLVERLNVVPVLYDAPTNALSVVTADPKNVDALDQIQKGAGVREVKPLVARPAAIQAAIGKFYRSEPFAFSALGKGKKELPGIDLGASPLGGGSPSGSFAMMGPGLEVDRVDRQSGETFAVKGPTRKPPPEKPVFTLPDIGLPAPKSEISESYLETLNVLVTLLENARIDLKGHSSQVARLTRKLCERISLAVPEQDAIVAAAYLHDLGKMSGYHLTALNVSQYAEPRAAAQRSYATPVRLMSGAKLGAGTTASIESMYERFDGGGFPQKIQGKDIPLGARVLAITDTYLDLTENPNNPFRKSLGAAAACDVLAKHQGTVFDPNLVELLRAMMVGDDQRARSSSKRYAALLVDPDPEETTVLELRMIQEGFEVRIARTAPQARAILEKGGIELVVSELDFSPATSGGAVGDGLALLAEARRSPWGINLPWLVLTRRSSHEDAQRSLELGAVDYVIKPAVTEVLVAKLKKTLERPTSLTPPGGGVSGSLAEMALPDLVQVLWHGRKSGALRIRRANEAGEVHFSDGMVVNAMWGKLRGEEAFYAMLRISQGEFVLDTNYRADEVAISASPESLLLEGMRRLDEG